VTAEITTIILTLNEEQNIECTLKSARGISKETFVVDSGSEDQTKAIAERNGARVFTHTFQTHAKQWNWALQKLPIQTDWVLAIDADQSLSEPLQQSIRAMLEKNPEGIDGYYLTRRYIFCGKWIRFGGYYPKHLLKLFRHGMATTDERELLDFRFYVASNQLGFLKGDLIEENHKDDDLSVWRYKHRQFAARQATEELQYRQGSGVGWKIQIHPFGSPDQRTLWWKHIWYHLPRYVRPFLYFFYRYFLRLGFLDGRMGFVFHGLQAFWYRFLVDYKIGKLKSESRGKTRQ